MKIDKEKFKLAKARACMGTKDIVEAGVPRGRLVRGEEARPETIGKVAKVLNVDVTEIIE